jgi:acetylornithine/N-succinyldiaminopimelate aminotransferase
LTDGFLYADAGDLQKIKDLVEENKVAAIMIEPVQGEGGVVALDKDFVLGLYELCKEQDILLIADEVQTGNGRTGALYGYMKYGIKPDIVSTAKGIGGGLPLGATMLFEKTENVYTPGSHGSTFGGNPIACAGAISIIERLNKDTLDGVKARSKYIFDTLSGAKGIKSVSGLGLMIGIETEKDSSEVLKKCMERGILPIKAKTKIRLLPALNIPMDELKYAIEILKEVAGE